MNLSIEQLFHYLDIWQALHKCHYFAPPSMHQASLRATGALGRPRYAWTPGFRVMIRASVKRLNPFSSESDCEAHAAEGALPSFRLTQFFKVQYICVCFFIKSLCGSQQDAHYGGRD